MDKTAEYSGNAPSAERYELLEREYKRLSEENRSLRRKYQSARDTIDRNSGYAHSRDHLFEALSAENANQKKFFRLLLEYVQDIMLLLDQGKRLVYCSDVFLERAGLGNFGLITDRPLDEILPRYAEGSASRVILNALDQVINTRQPQVLDQAIDIGMRGIRRQYRIYLAPMLNEEGDPEGALLLFYDLTEIMAAKEEAEQASRAKSSFLAQTSHEIRTPMNAVLGMSELALRADTLPKAHEYVAGIKQAGHNLLSIINDILDISKIEAGTMEITPAPYLLASLLNDVINIIRLRVAEKPIIFLADVDASIPNKLIGDEARIRQILLNLLSNAVKYTNRGVIRFTVRQEAPANNDRQGIILVLEVADSGIGIQEKDMPSLFRRFTRLDMKKNHGIEGTGLGLAITRNLCQAMGGDINLTSKYGEGTVFIVRIPQNFQSDQPLAVVENAGGQNVLCYDKRAPCIQSVCYTLKNLGVPFKVSASREELYRELEENKYSFAFVEAETAERAAKLAEEKNLQTPVVSLINSGELARSGQSLKNLRELVMPAYAVPVANLLNHQESAEPRKQQGGRFISPDAKILVVDDISTNLVVTAGLLAAYRARVDTCTSGAEAIALVEKKKYDMIFMDHMMPEMDGIESTQHIRAMNGDYYQTLPIIALTANAIAGMREMFLERGFNGYLSKPIEIAKLDEIMETWIPADKKIERGGEESSGDENEGEGILHGLTVEGLDLVMGKERYREKTYLEVLRSYTVHTPALIEKLRVLTKHSLSGDTIGEYTITTHGLKGSTYGICAHETAKMAEGLEHAARGGDLKYIERENIRLINSVESLLERIRELLAKAAEGAEEKPRLPSPDTGLLKQLLEACKRYRANVMDDVLVKLEASEYETGGDLVVWLREQADDLEYDAIRQRLESMAS